MKKQTEWTEETIDAFADSHRWVDGAANDASRRQTLAKDFIEVCPDPRNVAVLDSLQTESPVWPLWIRLLTDLASLAL